MIFHLLFEFLSSNKSGTPRFRDGKNDTSIAASAVGSPTVEAGSWGLSVRERENDDTPGFQGFIVVLLSFTVS